MHHDNSTNQTPPPAAFDGGRHPASQLTHENDITWLVDIRLPEYRYVRETLAMVHRRRGPIKWNGFRVVGWANLDAAARQSCGFFHRRVFWMKPYDPYDGPHGHGAPCEAADPMSVVPGVPGRVTARVLNRMIAEPAEVTI